MANKISRLAEKVYRLRMLRRIPAKDVAALIGVEPPLYSRIERGERTLKPEQLDILANFYQIDVEELHALQLADKMQQLAEGKPAAITEKAIEIIKEDLNA